MKAELLAIVEKATVELVQRGGQGVLVPGNLILTAAHCVEWTSTGAMVLGEHYRESIKTWDGRTLRVRPVAVEPVGDIAVLASLDDQECFDEALAFEQFCEEVRPAPICTLDFELFKPFPIKITYPLPNVDRWRGEAVQANRAEPVHRCPHTDRERDLWESGTR